MYLCEKRLVCKLFCCGCSLFWISGIFSGIVSAILSAMGVCCYHHHCCPYPPECKGWECIEWTLWYCQLFTQNISKELFVIAGDFNQTNLKKVLLKFYQHVTVPTRGNPTLDHVYTNVQGAYRAFARPHLVSSDHSSVMLMPSYQSLLKRGKSASKFTRRWIDWAM